jgi:hypothetical protein
MVKILELLGLFEAMICTIYIDKILSHWQISDVSLVCDLLSILLLIILGDMPISRVKEQWITFEP